MLDGDAAGEVHRRGRICPKRPFTRLLWGTFLAETRKVQRIDKLQFEAMFPLSYLQIKNKASKTLSVHKLG